MSLINAPEWSLGISLNHCIVYESLNRCHSDSKIDFDGIYSGHLNEFLKVVRTVLELWDLGIGRNEIRTV